MSSAQLSKRIFRFAGLHVLALMLMISVVAAAKAEPNDTRRAEERAWLESLPVAPKPELKRHGLVAKELRRWPARGAGQGVAVDGQHFYTIGNFMLGKYDKTTGARQAEWIGLRGGPIVHFNYGFVEGNELVVSHSNFPQLPMASSVETFDTRTMQPLKSYSLGIQRGSLTWATRKDGFWWACFANYNDKGTTPGLDNRWTYFGKFDDRWQLVESWIFPPELIAAFGRTSCSGGSWGDDGQLYVTGHDAEELYVLRLPKMGPTLELVTTIAVPFAGQAWAWDRAQRRVIYGISRNSGEVIVCEIPELPAELRSR
jgi:hypothetical protein